MWALAQHDKMSMKRGMSRRKWTYVEDVINHLRQGGGTDAVLWAEFQQAAGLGQKRPQGDELLHDWLVDKRRVPLSQDKRCG